MFKFVLAIFFVRFSNVPIIYFLNVLFQNLHNFVKRCGVFALDITSKGVEGKIGNTDNHKNNAQNLWNTQGADIQTVRAQAFNNRSFNAIDDKIWKRDDTIVLEFDAI